jgi:hypothetical protein
MNSLGRLRKKVGKTPPWLIGPHPCLIAPAKVGTPLRAALSTLSLSVISVFFVVKNKGD